MARTAEAAESRPGAGSTPPRHGSDASAAWAVQERFRRHLGIFEGQSTARADVLVATPDLSQGADQAHVLVDPDPAGTTAAALLPMLATDKSARLPERIAASDEDSSHDAQPPQHAYAKEGGRELRGTQGHQARAHGELGRAHDSQRGPAGVPRPEMLLAGIDSPPMTVQVHDGASRAWQSNSLQGERRSVRIDAAALPVWVAESAHRVGGLFRSADPTFRSFSVTLPLDPVVLPDSELSVALSHGALTLRFHTRSRHAAVLIYQHLSRLRGLLHAQPSVPSDLTIDLDLE